MRTFRYHAEGGYGPEHISQPKHRLLKEIETMETNETTNCTFAINRASTTLCSTCGKPASEHVHRYVPGYPEDPMPCRVCGLPPHGNTVSPQASLDAALRKQTNEKETQARACAELEKGCSVTAGRLDTEKFYEEVSGRTNDTNEAATKAAFEKWRENRPDWGEPWSCQAEACFEAYCAGRLDEKTAKPREIVEYSAVSRYNIGRRIIIGGRSWKGSDGSWGYYLLDAHDDPIGSFVIGFDTEDDAIDAVTEAAAEAEAKADYDPTPYCAVCKARTKADCDCPPRAANE